MATYTHKRCPHCGTLYETYSTHTKHFSNHSGSPFLTCKSCGETFVDKDIKEPALKPYSGSGFSIFNCIFAGFWPFGFAGIILTGAAISPETSSIAVAIIAIIVDAIYLWITGFAIKNRKQLQLENKKEYEASLERLKNREYALALKNAGFKVPSHFLKENQENSVKYVFEEDNSTTGEDIYEKYNNYDTEFIELLISWYSRWKNKNTKERYYELPIYLDTLNSCFRKNGQSALDFCYELYGKKIPFDESIASHTFNQLNDVIACNNDGEINWLKQKVVNGLDGFYVAWVLEHP